MLIAVAVAFCFAREVPVPIVLGVMLAPTLSPVIRAAERIGLPPPLSAATLILALAAPTGIGGYGMSGPVSD